MTQLQPLLDQLIAATDRDYRLELFSEILQEDGEDGFTLPCKDWFFLLRYDGEQVSEIAYLPVDEMESFLKGFLAAYEELS